MSPFWGRGGRYLVVHQGDEGGDHQGDARGALAVEVSGELVAKGLAQPRGEHQEGGKTSGGGQKYSKIFKIYKKDKKNGGFGVF